MPPEPEFKERTEAISPEYVSTNGDTTSSQRKLTTRIYVVNDDG